MACSTLTLLFLFGLVCLASAQTNSTITDPDADGVDELPAANSTDTANTTEAACPLTEAALAGVDLTNATTACAGEGVMLPAAADGGVGAAALLFDPRSAINSLPLFCASHPDTPCPSFLLPAVLLPHAESTSEGFCSACLCSIATALVAGSPTFSALAASPNATDLNLNTLVEQCAGEASSPQVFSSNKQTETALYRAIPSFAARGAGLPTCRD